ncbi:hypothetical protein [Myxococcus sp. AS-1-15]|uniref:hypothetical protein n=1 Tax=Myxococcus sp. AS-1-15 TaxID=2874600 RepID=UPI001CBCFCB7|nr:hypothetical protein [Myxococcus sp. AS-1-15]MBZ4402418.1 hypothetical protein [Myxococcus sp. AS-1-15]
MQECIQPPTVTTLHSPLLVPSETKNAALIGTAFDYLLRFELERRISFSATRPWVAEEGLQRLRSLKKPPVGPETIRTAEHIVKRATAAHAEFLSTGEPSKDLLVVLIQLAEVDLLIRSRKPTRSRYFGYASPDDVRELSRLFAVLPREIVTAHSRCLLNPTFGTASTAIGGADADLILDDTLIEIKTASSPTITQAYLAQLSGYYILAQLNEPLPTEFSINHFGIYFARHGRLVRFPVEQVLPLPSRMDLIDFFARQLNLPKRADPTT